jgi:hypothetical protein
MSEAPQQLSREVLNAAVNVIRDVCVKAPLVDAENTAMKQALQVIEAVCRECHRLRTEAAQAAIAAAKAAQEKPPKPNETLVDGNTVHSISVEVPELKRLADLDKEVVEGGEQPDGIVGEGLPAVDDAYRYIVCSVSKAGTILSHYSGRENENEIVYWTERVEKAHWMTASSAVEVLAEIPDIYRTNGITQGVYEIQGGLLVEVQPDDDYVDDGQGNEPIPINRVE